MTPTLDKCEHCFDNHICLWCGLIDNQKSVMDIYLGNVKVIYDIKPIRDYLMITQAEVAVMIGVSRLTYIKWENNQDLMPIGKYKETIDNFSKLYQKKLEVSL
jgi:DNA-binding XRE family transcriptional regulator